MTFCDLVDAQLVDAGIAPRTAADPEADPERLLPLVSGCIVRAISYLGSRLAAAAPQVAFEVDTATDYDPETQHFSSEVYVTVHGRVSYPVSAVLLETGLQYMADTNTFQVNVHLPLHALKDRG